MENCPYTRVMAEPVGQVTRLEPRDGRVWMNPSDCFGFINEMGSKVMCWQ